MKKTSAFVFALAAMGWSAAAEAQTRHVAPKQPAVQPIKSVFTSKPGTIAGGAATRPGSAVPAGGFKPGTGAGIVAAGGGNFKPGAGIVAAGGGNFRR